MLQSIGIVGLWLATLTSASARSTVVPVLDLGLCYGVNASNGSMAVGQVYQDEATVEAAFPAWYAHWRGTGRDTRELMSQSLFTCAWNDAVARYAEVPGAAITIHAPAGQFRVDHALYVINGEFQGMPDGATRLVMDAEYRVVPEHGSRQPAALMQVWPGFADARDLRVTDLAFTGSMAGMGESAGAMRLEWPEESVTIERVSATGFSGTAIEVDGARTTRLQDIALADNATGIALQGCTGTQHVAQRITGSANGTWFRTGPWQGSEASNTWRIAEVSSTTEGRTAGGRLLASQGPVQVEFNGVRMAGEATGAWVEAARIPRDSRISGTEMFMGESSKPLVLDLDRRAAYRAAALPGKVFDFCWVPGSPQGPLPSTCAVQEARTAQPLDQPAFPGGLKSGGASISIGAASGPVLTDLEWGYNTSGLFSINSGSDTALQNRLTELAPRIIRFPGGTLSNFYHPTGLGYGIRSQDVDLVSGTSVYDNIHSTYTDEQADISAGDVPGNYIQDIIELALANNTSVLYVANLFTGTVGEMVAVINAMRDAGVQVAGVELGNEAHLKAYESRFGSVENYLTVAQLYANAISSNFPGLKIGLDGYPPGILKDLGPGGTQHAHDWNVACSNATFGDALIIHCYSRPTACDQTGITANFNCGADFSQVYANDKMPQALSELASLGNKEIWITEWNIDGPYSHYGNSMAQALFYADMSFTMAQQSKVTFSAYHNLLSWDNGYNVVRQGNGVHDPQVNYWSGIMFEDFYRTGNQPQDVSVTGLAGVRAFAFLSTDGRQHLYVINRSGSPMDLSSFQGTAQNVEYTMLGSTDIAEGSGSNAARDYGNVLPHGGVAVTIGDVQLLPYSIAQLSWMPVAAPPPNSLVWKSTFGGNNGCNLKAVVGTDVAQSNSNRCANISGGHVTTLPNSAFPVSINVSKVVLMGVTFSNVAPGKWINGRARFAGSPGQIKDVVTGQVLGTVQAGVYYDQLVLDFGQPVPLSSLIGKPNGGNATAPMTIEAMKLLQ